LYHGLQSPDPLALPIGLYSYWYWPYYFVGVVVLSFDDDGEIVAVVLVVASNRTLEYEFFGPTSVVESRSRVVVLPVAKRHIVSIFMAHVSSTFCAKIFFAAACVSWPPLDADA
jgi:hypothetical protein